MFSIKKFAKSILFCIGYSTGVVEELLTVGQLLLIVELTYHR